MYDLLADAQYVPYRIWCPGPAYYQQQADYKGYRVDDKTQN
jgi:hypothetical protein